MKKLNVLWYACAASCMAMAEVPQPDNVTMRQLGSGVVEVSYTLSATAVITLDIQTNRTGSATADEADWVSIGGSHIRSLNGDVSKKVEFVSNQNVHKIVWSAYKDWPEHKVTDGTARAKVTAWALDNTPNYMVVSLLAGDPPNSPRYYQGADFLPGGLLENDEYKKTRLVLRRIPAKGVTWTKGSINEDSSDMPNERAYLVEMTNDYYMGVFEITQYQWYLLTGSDYMYSGITKDDLRPKSWVSYEEIRLRAFSASNLGDGYVAESAADLNYMWPHAPHESSFLGLLNARTGMSFDLPSDAEWEYATRAGHGNKLWGDGSAMYAGGNWYVCNNLNRLGRYSKNIPTSAGETDTAVVGSYEANSWGLYDVHGNVSEFCLDYSLNDITPYGGAVNISLGNPANCLDGSAGLSHVAKGGNWGLSAHDVRPARRDAVSLRRRMTNVGFRVRCQAGLQ